jgi:hypothetical protein
VHRNGHDKQQRARKNLPEQIGNVVVLVKLSELEVYELLSLWQVDRDAGATLLHAQKKHHPQAIKYVISLTIRNNVLTTPQAYLFRRELVVRSHCQVRSREEEPTPNIGARKVSCTACRNLWGFRHRVAVAASLHALQVLGGK